MCISFRPGIGSKSSPTLSCMWSPTRRPEWATGQWNFSSPPPRASFSRLSHFSDSVSSASLSFSSSTGGRKSKTGVITISTFLPSLLCNLKRKDAANLQDSHAQLRFEPKIGGPEMSIQFSIAEWKISTSNWNSKHTWTSQEGETPRGESVSFRRHVIFTCHGYMGELNESPIKKW